MFIGHPNLNYMKRMVMLDSVQGLNVTTSVFPEILACNSCDLAKGHRIPHNNNHVRSLKLLDNVHLDLSGIIRTSAICGSQYFMLFTDDYSSYRHVVGLPTKSADVVFDKIKQYISLVERQCDTKLKRITLDNGYEFINDTMVPYCKEVGIYLRTTATYTPEENGVAERSNRTITEPARAMMIEANLPIKFWLYAIKSAVYLKNRTISSALPVGKTPFELWNHRKPDIAHVHPIGCLCYVLIRKPLRGGKFEQVSRQAMLLSHTDHNINYEVFIFETNTIVISHNVIFRDNIFPFRKMKSFDISHLSFSDDDVEQLSDPSVLEPQVEEQDDDVLVPGGEGMHQDAANPTLILTPALDNVNLDQEQQQPPVRRSSRERFPVDRYRPSASFAYWDDEGAFKDLHDYDPYAFAVTSTIRLINEPHTFKSAMNNSDRDSWKKACDKEMNNMKVRGVWHLVPRPKDQPVVGSIDTVVCR